MCAYYCSSKKQSPTKPGRGIRKVADLYHDLSDLVIKANLHAGEIGLDPSDIEDLDLVTFCGMTNEAIAAEKEE